MIKIALKKILKYFPNLIKFLRNSRDLLDQNSPAKLTKWGFTLAGNDSMSSGIFEPEETILVTKLLDEVDHFINVGANIGYYICHALNKNKTVTAVEPVTRNLHYLLQNIKANGWESKSEVFPIALSESNSILNIWGGNTGASLIQGWASIPDNYVTQVPVLTLDRIIGNTIDNKRTLILVDIEGAEYFLLLGAKKILDNKPKPIWLIEISITEHQPKGVQINPNLLKTFQILWDCGYQSFTANEELREILPHEVNDILNSGLDSIRSDNFIFIERGFNSSIFNKH